MYVTETLLNSWTDFDEIVVYLSGSLDSLYQSWQGSSSAIGF